MIKKDGGGGQFFDFMGTHSCYEGGIELMGVPLVPPTRENPAHVMIITIEAIYTGCPKKCPVTNLNNLRNTYQKDKKGAFRKPGRVVT